jgi:histidine triad (HIT) family protein
MIFRELFNKQYENWEEKEMANPEKREACLFCRIIKKELPSVVVHEDNNVIAILDVFPATPGHTLVLPKAHIENIYSMPPETGAQIMNTAIMLAKSMKQQLKPAGLNLVQSNGASAGQEIFHFHLHVLPRYEHDSVSFKFGHGTAPTGADELEKVAEKIRAVLSE